MLFRAWYKGVYRNALFPFEILSSLYIYTWFEQAFITANGIGLSALELTLADRAKVHIQSSNSHRCVLSQLINQLIFFKLQGTCILIWLMTIIKASDGHHFGSAEDIIFMQQDTSRQKALSPFLKTHLMHMLMHNWYSEDTWVCGMWV